MIFIEFQTRISRVLQVCRVTSLRDIENEDEFALTLEDNVDGNIKEGLDSDSENEFLQRLEKKKK